MHIYSLTVYYVAYSCQCQCLKKIQHLQLFWHLVKSAQVREFGYGVGAILPDSIETLEVDDFFD